MKTIRQANPKNFTVRRVLVWRGGAGACPNAKKSGGRAAGGSGASRA
ncbi:MAG: hypothetical protein IJW77_11795 [Clostridia bacterium]|nr:hypothetical protein [Clostridia bacterium]